jgi:hypothetical protein
MEILWPAFGIGAIVCFVLYVLASHWQQTLRQQSWLVRQLANRMRVLEELDDPQFRRLLGESSPMPLDRVFTLSFRLNDHFWSDVLHLREEARNYVRMSASFVGSVKLECWRSHTVASITEVLPESKTARWRTRSLDFYPDLASEADALVLWELRFARPNGSPLKPASLELTLTKDAIEFSGHSVDALSNGSLTTGLSSSQEARQTQAGKNVRFFRVPLDTALLGGFRTHNPLNASANGNGNEESEVTEASITPMNGTEWQAFYQHRDDDLGVEWQLHLRDLTKKAEWERWRVMESRTVTHQSDET